MSKKFLSVIISSILIFSCVAFAVEAEEAGVVRFGVFSDTHNNADGIKNVFDNIYELSENGTALDGVIMNGDIVYMQQGVTPAASHYESLLSNTKYQELKKAGKIIYEMGNHEFPLNSEDDETLTQQALEMFKEQTGFDTQMHTVLSGYHFINAAPENYSGGMQSRESYMREEIEKALSDGTEKPVFLMVHHPVPSSVVDSPGETSTRFSTEFRDYINNQPRLIVLSGHTHEPETDPRSIRQYVGGCTYVQTSHVSGGANVTSSYATHGHSKKVSQAMMMEINPDTNVVTLKRFYVDSTGAEYLETGDWVLDIPQMILAKESADTSDDLEAFKYTFEERSLKSVAPLFAAESKAVVSDIAGQSVKVSFPAALAASDDENDIIKFYEIKVYDVDAAQILKTDIIISDHFLKEEARRSEFVHSVLGLSQDTNYRLEVCATTTWYKKSKPITVEFQTLQEEKFDAVTLDEAYTYTVAAKDISNDNNSQYHRGTYIQVPSTASSHKFTATFSITNPGMYRFMASSIGSNGAPTTAVICKSGDNGEKTVLKTSEVYISTGGPTSYNTNIPYADLALTAGTYTMTWSIGNSGDTTTLNGLKVGRFAPLPVEYLEEYAISMTAAEYSDTSEAVEDGVVPESFALSADGYVTWSVSPEYTGIYKLSYDFSGGAAKTTITSQNVLASGETVDILPENEEVMQGESIELQLFTHITYNFTITASEDNVTVNGMNLIWQEDFIDLENESYKFTYNDGTDLSYGNIDFSTDTATVQPHIAKDIVVPIDANYTFSLNVGAAKDITAHIYVERASGGSVTLATTGATDTTQNRMVFSDVPLKAGEVYKVTIFNGTSGQTLKVQDLVFETSGEYLADIDDLTFLASDYTYRKAGLAASMSHRHRMGLTDNYNMSYKLKPGAGNYKVYAYCRTYTGSPNITMSVDGAAIGTYSNTYSSSIKEYELGTIRVTDDEFTLNIALPNTTDTTRLWFYRFRLEAVDAPEVTIYSGTSTDSAHVITSLQEGGVTAKAYLPEEVNGSQVTMALAVYEDNRLYKVGTYSLTGKKNSVIAVTLDDLAFKEGKAYTSKVFFWESAEKMLPIYDNPAEGSLTGAKEVES